MDPERREDVLNHVSVEDEEVDADIDTSNEQYRRRDRSPSPPPPPPAYHEPNWSGEPPEDEYEPVELDQTRLILQADEEVDEEDSGKWVKRIGTRPTLEDMDSSDDEYVDNNPRLTMIRRKRMQRYRDNRGTGPRQMMIEEFLDNPDLQAQPRFNDLPMETEMDSEMRQMHEDNAFNRFWRMLDRNWCFFCSYKRRNLEGHRDATFDQIEDMWRRPLFDQSEECIVDATQSLFFVMLQHLLPPRKPCKRTGKPRPPHYLWKSSIRRHFHEHEHRPTHDKLKMRSMLMQANDVLGSMTFKRHKKNRTDVQFDGQRMRHIRDNIDTIIKLDALIAKETVQHKG